MYSDTESQSEFVQSRKNTKAEYDRSVETLLGAKWSLSVLSQQVGAPCLTAVIVPEINNLASFSIVWARRAEAWRHVIF